MSNEQYYLVRGMCGWGSLTCVLGVGTSRFAVHYYKPCACVIRNLFFIPHAVRLRDLEVCPSFR